MTSVIVLFVFLAVLFLALLKSGKLVMSGAEEQMSEEDDETTKKIFVVWDNLYWIDKNGKKRNIDELAKVCSTFRRNDDINNS